MAQDFSLEGSIGVNARDFVKGMDDAADSVEELVDTAEQGAVEIQKSFDDLEPDVDTSDIDQRFDDLERAANDLEDELDDLDNAKISPKVDTGGLDKASKSTERVAETAQRGIGPLRGLTDELGESSGAAGIAANAFIDGGEAIEIMGERAGLSEAMIGKLGTGMLVAGGVVAGASLLYSQFSAAAKRAEERVEGFTEAIEELNEALPDTEKVAEQILDTMPDLFETAEAAGVSVLDVVKALQGEISTSDIPASVERWSDEWRLFERRLQQSQTAWDKATDSVADHDEKLTAVEEALRETNVTTAENVETLAGYKDNMDIVIDDLERFGRTAVEETSIASLAWDNLRRSLNLELETARAEEAFKRIAAAARRDGDITETEISQMKLAVLDYAESLGDLPAEVQTKVLALVDEESPRVAKAYLDAYFRSNPVEVPVFVRPILPPGVAPRLPEYQQTDPVQPPQPAPSVPPNAQGGAPVNATNVQVFIDGQEIRRIATSAVAAGGSLSSVYR